MNPALYFWLLLKASLFSTTGLGNLPILHDDLIGRGWATDHQFAEALAVGQVSPGPSGLWVISLGYLTNGLCGALLATLAITLPPLLVLILAQLYRRIGDHPAVQGFLRGLGLSVVGVFLVTMLGLLDAQGIEPRTVLLVSASVGLGFTRRVPVVVLLGLAAGAGVLLF